MISRVAPTGSDFSKTSAQSQRTDDLDEPASVSGVILHYEKGKL